MHKILYSSFKISLIPLLVIICTTISTNAFAQLPSTDIESPTQVKSKTLGDELENLGLIYKNEKNETLQELWILGRYHGQYYWSEAGTADDDGFETRRMRLGFQSRLFKKMTLHAQMVSGSDVSPFYNGFTELWGQWAFSPEFAVTIGQQKNRFTHDRNVSSRYLNYLERSMLTNMFGADYTPAVTAQGKLKDLNYYTGLFSNATGQNMGEAFTELNSGYSYIAATYYDLGPKLGADNTVFYTSYVHSDAKDNATNLNNFDNGISPAIIFTKGRGSLVTEVTSGIGGKNGNALGINIQPGYFLSDQLQLVSRFQLASSNNDQGLKPQRRYESEVDLPSGDLYQAAYAGLNYYIAKHRLKIMNGVEYANLAEQDVWTFSSMIRFYFGPHSGGAFPMNQILDNKFESD